MATFRSIAASTTAVVLVISASPAAGLDLATRDLDQSDTNVSRAVSKWTKSKGRYRLRLEAEGIAAQDGTDEAAFGRLSITRCGRPDSRGREVCIGTSTVKPLDPAEFEVEDDLSGAVLEMVLRGRSHIVVWNADDDGTVQPDIGSPQQGRANVSRDAAASGEFMGSSVAVTQLEEAQIGQVVDALPEEAPPVPLPVPIPDPPGKSLAAGSSTCWNYKRSERGFARKMNEARAKQGLAKLRLDPELSKVSRVHTAEMIKADLLHHATSVQITNRVTNWEVVGENVGVGGTVASLHDAFMNSPAHKANIMFAYNFVGVGVAKSGDRMWVTVTFSKGPNPGTTLNMPRC